MMRYTDTQRLTQFHAMWPQIKSLVENFLFRSLSVAFHIHCRKKPGCGMSQKQKKWRSKPRDFFVLWYHWSIRSAADSNSRTTCQASSCFPARVCARAMVIGWYGIYVVFVYPGKAYARTRCAILVTRLYSDIFYQWWSCIFEICYR